MMQYNYLFTALSISLPRQVEQREFTNMNKWERYYYQQFCHPDCTLSHGSRLWRPHQTHSWLLTGELWAASEAALSTSCNTTQTIR